MLAVVVANRREGADVESNSVGCGFATGNQIGSTVRKGGYPLVSPFRDDGLFERDIDSLDAAGVEGSCLIESDGVLIRKQYIRGRRMNSYC